MTILDERIFLSLLEIEDEVDQQRELFALQNRAAELGKKTEFLKLWKAYQKQKRTMEREQNTFRIALIIRSLCAIPKKGRLRSPSKILWQS